MRVLSIKVPIQKKSWNLFNDPRIGNSIKWAAEVIMHDLNGLYK